MQDGDLKNGSLLRLLRLIRMARMTRLVRLVRAMPELMILIKGMIMATRSVLLTMLLLCIVIYVFGIAMTTMTADDKEIADIWGTVPTSMLTLLLHGCFLEDLPDVVKRSGNESVVYGIIILLFVLLATMTIMNMLVGVLCEVVSCVAAIEKETLQVRFVRATVFESLQTFDKDHDNMISRIEFEEILATPVVARALLEVNIDVIGLVDFADYIFRDADSISFMEFMDTILQLRGSNMATVKDIVDLRRAVLLEMHYFEQRVCGERPSRRFGGKSVALSLSPTQSTTSVQFLRD
jgi:voltage-gated sodium channel